MTREVEKEILENSTVVLLTMNRAEQLVETLEVLFSQLGDVGEVIVVDNGSSDATADVLGGLRDRFGCLRIIRNPVNVGVAAGRAQGWVLASGRYILAIDDDIQISRQAFLEIVRTLRTDRDAAVVSPVIVDSRTGRHLNPCVRGQRQATYFYEGCFGISRIAIDTVGLMDPAFATAGEGLDYSLRLLKAGLKIVRLCDVRVVHVDRERTSGETAGRRIEWAWSFARVYFKHYHPASAALRTTRMVVAHAVKGLRSYGLRFCAGVAAAAIAGACSGRAMRRRL